MSEPSSLPPAGKNPPLQRFDALVGEWTMVGSHPAFPATTHGTSVFEWLVEGGLLLWRFDWEKPGPPSAVSVIGRDDSDDVCSMVYADERGVTRLYRTSLQNGVWKMWRDAAEFSQRMTGEFSHDGRVITVHGELSRDGSTWEPDLDVTYTRRSG